MNVYGDYAASIVYNHRSGELREEARKDRLARQAKTKVRANGRPEARRKDRAASRRRARTA